MPSVAEQLRQGRETLHLSVYQVADQTKIKTDHIRALEEGNYSVFTAPVYIRGFVRTYATILKLEAPRVLAALDQELRQIEKFREPPSLTRGQRGLLDALMYQFSKVNWRMVLPVFVIAAMIAAGIWGLRFWRNRPSQDPLSNLGPGLYHNPPGNNSAQTLPLPTNAATPKK